MCRTLNVYPGCLLSEFRVKPVDKIAPQKAVKANPFGSALTTVRSRRCGPDEATILS